jgi:3-hydroxybutyryl-CoA dehydrogenase
MHFFNPPPLMKLVEIVAAEHSAEEALARTTEVAGRMGRTPIRAKDSPGFVAHRLARPFSLESLRMLGDAVADVPTIDRAVRLGGGFRMGPFELLDLIGLDVNLEIARSFFVQSGEVERWRPSPIQEQLVAEGKFGRKSGHGYYDYSEGSAREADPDLGIEAPTLDSEQLAKIHPVAEEVLSRLFAQIANETAFALEEEVASSADMEMAMRLGFNWPAGPRRFAELIGPRRALELLERLQATGGAAYRPAPRLRAEAEGAPGSWKRSRERAGRYGRTPGRLRDLPGPHRAPGKRDRTGRPPVATEEYRRRPAAETDRQRAGRESGRGGPARHRRALLPGRSEGALAGR